MTSRNINKIVQSNINLKPWMLSRNTNEMVNAYVQKIYKRMPTSFNKGIKTVKVASSKVENRGPLSTLKNLEKELPSASITARAAAVKKSNSRMKQQTNNLINYLNKSNKNNEEMANKFNSKRLMKTPNYKIYRSLRYGSSSGSSRSSLFKRYDERRRQKQTFPAQINYLIRSFHTSKFEPTYARFLMPARNQQLESNLGSIPDAVKFSSDMLKDLMKIEKKRNNGIFLVEDKKPKAERCGLDQWHHPPALSTYKIKIPKESAIKHVTSHMESGKRRAKLSPEHRDNMHINVARSIQFKHPRPPNELFTAEHDRKDTELHEKHRRNRMKKLGLIESDNGQESDQPKCKSLENKLSYTVMRTESALKSGNETFPRLYSLPKNINSSLMPDKNEISSLVKSSMIPIKIHSKSSKVGHKIASGLSRAGYCPISPVAAARTQMPQKNDSRSYRYKRSDFFSTKKY